MKKIILSLVVALAAITSSFAQYYNGEPVGTVYEYEITNPLMGTMKSEYTLLSVDETAISFKTATAMPGQASPLIMNQKFTIKGNKAYQDPQNTIDAAKASMAATLGTSDINVTLDGETGFIPLTGHVGDKYPLFKYNNTINAMGMEVVTKNEVTKFEVVREEEITTPAGTFKTFVVEMNSKSTTEVMGQSQGMEMSQLYWIVPNKGVVKIEQNMSGQKMTTTLVSIK